MPSIARAFRSNATVAATMHPWLTPHNWLSLGAFIGFELRTGRPVFLDFQLLKKLEIIHSAVVQICGIKNHGKSALAKSLSLRLLALQAGFTPYPIRYPLEPTARFNDRKGNSGRGEYADVTKYLMADVVELSRMASINLFDPKMGMTELEIVHTAVDLVVEVRGEPMKRFQTLAIQIAAKKMLAQSRLLSAPDSLERILWSIELQDVVDYFTAVDNKLMQQYTEYTEEMRKERGGNYYQDELQLVLEAPNNLLSGKYPELMDQLIQDAAYVAASLSELLRATYGNQFTGNGSMYDLFTATVTNIDWTGVEAKAGELLESNLLKWQRKFIDRNQTEMIPTVVTYDEEGSEVNRLMHARARAEYSRKARTVPTTDISISQYITDYSGLGAENSELRSLGKVIDNGFGVRIIGAQPDNEESLQRIKTLGAPDQEAYRTAHLPPHCWAIMIPGQKTRYFQHVLMPSEVSLVETNSANARATDRIPVSSFEHIQKRIERIGAVKIGVS